MTTDVFLYPHQDVRRARGPQACLYHSRLFLTYGEVFTDV